jgi:protein-S-isoprenylcysteine O-methyltransferase Ste14
MVAKQIILIATLVLMGFGAYHRSRAAKSGDRFDRRKEGLPVMIGIRLTGLILMILTILWFWHPALLAWGDVPVSQGFQSAGVVLYVLAALWMIWMYRTLDRNLTDTVQTRSNAVLVTHGPYRYVRNPMYVGLLAICLSLGLAQRNILIPLCGVVLFAQLAVRTRIEERFLIARFGDVYVRYMARVGRFWPRFYRPEDPNPPSPRVESASSPSSSSTAS